MSTQKTKILAIRTPHPHTHNIYKQTKDAPEEKAVCVPLMVLIDPVVSH